MRLIRRPKKVLRIRKKRKPRRIIMIKSSCFNCDKSIHSPFKKWKFEFCQACADRLLTYKTLPKRKCPDCGKKKQLTFLEETYWEPFNSPRLEPVPAWIIEPHNMICGDCGVNQLKKSLGEAAAIRLEETKVQDRKAYKLARRMVKKGFKKGEVREALRDLLRSFRRGTEDWVKKQAKILQKRAKKDRT